MARFLAGRSEQSIGWPREAGADRAKYGADGGTHTAGDRDHVDGWLVSGVFEHGHALPVLHHQYCDGQGHHQLQHRGKRPHRGLDDGLRQSQLPHGSRIETARHRHRQSAHQQGTNDRRQALAPIGPGRQQQKDSHHGHCNGHIALQRPHDVEAKTQKHPGHHAHDNRHGQRRHDPLDPAAQAQHQNQRTGHIKSANHLGKTQVLQGRTH